MFKIQAIAAELFRYFYNKVRGKRGNAQRTYFTVRGQSYFSRLPKY